MGDQDKWYRVKVRVNVWDKMCQEGMIHNDNYVMEDKMFKDEYPEDERWVMLKKASTKAYKELKDYEYEKRNFKDG